MDLLPLLVVHCVLLGANAATTLPPDPTTASDVQNEVSSSSPPEQEYNISTCQSDKDVGSRFVLQRDFKQWFGALAACARQGMRLAVPRSPQEAAALGALLYETPDRPLPLGDVMTDAMFVGIHNIEQASDWHTLDGSLLSEAGYDLWLEGGAGECGALLGDGRYVRQPCHTRMRFACEARSSAAATARRLASGYEAVGDAGRFRLYEEPLAWGLALRRCEAEGGTLAVPASERHAGLLAGALFTRARANARLQRHGFFVGVTDLAQEDQWRTVAGVSLGAAGYSSWKPGEPSGGRRENCGVLLKDGRFADHSCTEPMPYCCQENIAASDSEDLVETRGRYRLHKKPLTWFEAVLACQRENGTLVSPVSREGELLTNMMNSNQHDMYGNRITKVSSIHVGIYDFFGNETWKSINEESQNLRQTVNYLKRRIQYPRTFDEYASPESNDYDDFDNHPLNEMFTVRHEYEGHKCVKMDYYGNFENQLCFNKLPYVCKGSD
ncbi:hypothetical protein R5R35_014764 [Gryllus longicercus]|uniref:C-type lectin domain-containing protein n=1 Tax=Gryllus longicercus TaxID=2509291 RepID=A0AAN9VU09_9ORTH